MSKVGGIQGFKGEVALFRVQEELADLSFELKGEGASSFAVTEKRKEENGLLFFKVGFQPAMERGFFGAELVVGSGEETQVVQLRGVATKALEGKNEPPLQEILKALGTEIDAGGETLSLDTEKPAIGDSITVTEFEVVGDASVKFTPLARYSPPGETPFGFAIQEGEELRLETIGKLAVTTSERPDAHQAIRPPLAGEQGTVVVADAPARFGLFLKAHKYTSLTFPGRSEGATIKHTARIYPVKMFEGRALENAYVVGFEEASNGDYQDAVFLIEGVKAVK